MPPDDGNAAPIRRNGGFAWPTGLLYLFETLDDTKIAFGGLVENLERGLIALAVVGRDRLLDAVELDDHDALGDACLVDLGSLTPCQETPPAGRDRRGGEFGVGRQGLRIRNRPID